MGLRDALQRNGNNRTKAAEDLGVSRVTLYKKSAQTSADVISHRIPLPACGQRR